MSKVQNERFVWLFTINTNQSKHLDKHNPNHKIARLRLLQPKYPQPKHDDRKVTLLRLFQEV